jgi:hypothetical protein
VASLVGIERASADVAESTAAKVEESFMLMRCYAEVDTLSLPRFSRLFMLLVLIFSKVHPIAFSMANNEQTCFAAYDSTSW